MEFLYILLLSPLPIFISHVPDPAPGLSSTREEVRSLDCEVLSQPQAHELYPAEVAEARARRIAGPSDSVLVCNRRILAPSERPARDEAILSSLRQTMAEMVQAASALTPGEPVWHVDAFYPEPAVGVKIAVAARTELAERGHKVSDRVPVLAAGDLAVLSGLPGSKAYPLACARSFAEHVLSDKEALLGLMILDGRETQLHAGVCRAGAWRWLR